MPKVSQWLVSSPGNWNLNLKESEAVGKTWLLTCRVTVASSSWGRRLPGFVWACQPTSASAVDPVRVKLLGSPSNVTWHVLDELRGEGAPAFTLDGLRTPDQEAGLQGTQFETHWVR